MANQPDFRTLLNLLENIERDPVSGDLLARITAGLETPQSLKERLQNPEQLDEVDFKKAAAGLGAAAALGAGAGGAQAQTAGDWLNLAKNVAGAVQQAQAQTQAPQAPQAQQRQLQDNERIVIRLGKFANAQEATPVFNQLRNDGLTDITAMQTADGGIAIISKERFSDAASARAAMPKFKQVVPDASFSIIKISQQQAPAAQTEPPRQAQAQQPEPPRQVQKSEPPKAEPTKAPSNQPQQYVTGTGKFKIVKMLVQDETGKGYDFSNIKYGVDTVTTQNGTLRAINWEGNVSSLLKGRLVSSKKSVENGKEVTEDVYENTSFQSMGQLGSITTKHRIIVKKVGDKITIIHVTQSSNGSSSNATLEQVK